MAWTQSDLDTLNAAIASGILRVRFADGRETTYQSAADMLKVRAQMVADINAGARSGRVRTTVGRIRRPC